MRKLLPFALLDKKVTLEFSFVNERVTSPKLKEARKKVALVVHPEWPSGRSALVIPVTVKLRNGKAFTNRVEKVKGTASMPLTPEEQLERYREFSQPFLSASQIEQSAQFILKLEESKDITELMRIVTFGREGALK